MVIKPTTSSVDEAPMIAEVVCPRCTATLDAAADHCPNCGHSTPIGPGQTPDRPLIDRPWLIVLAVLHVGALGIPLYWKTSYSLTTRLLLIGVSIVYTVLAVAGILWGSWQIWQMLQGV